MIKTPHIYKKFIGLLIGVDLDRKEAERQIPRVFRMDKKDVRQTMKELEVLGMIKKKKREVV